MKEAMVQMARYNVWANARMLAALSGLPEAMMDAETVSSFPSIRCTIAHLRAAEHIWLERLLLAERPAWTGDDLADNFPTLAAQWRAASEGLLRFCEKQYNDMALLHVVEYHDLKGALHKTPVFAIFQHIFNHSTFHRGQLVTMMRTLGAMKIPQTDYIHFVRMGGK